MVCDRDRRDLGREHTQLVEAASGVVEVGHEEIDRGLPAKTYGQPVAVSDHPTDRLGLVREASRRLKVALADRRIAQRGQRFALERQLVGGASQLGGGGESHFGGDEVTGPGTGPAGEDGRVDLSEQVADLGPEGGGLVDQVEPGARIGDDHGVAKPVQGPRRRLSVARGPGQRQTFLQRGDGGANVVGGGDQPAQGDQRPATQSGVDLAGRGQQRPGVAGAQAVSAGNPPVKMQVADHL